VTVIMNSSFNLKQNGFTLVELMVGMLLSLILIAGLFTIYLSSKQTNRTSEGVISAQSDGQLVLSFLKEDIAKTGWVNNSSNSYSLSSPLPADFATYDGGIGPDTLKVHYESCDNSDIDNNCLPSGIDRADCNGVGVAAGAIITNTYEVNADNELTCNDQPLINNVQDFQVLYGELTNDGLRNVTADNISNSSKIHSIRFGVILNAQNSTSDNNTARNIQLLDKTVNLNDKKIHLKYESTVAILNKPHI